MQAPQELFKNARQAMSLGQNDAAREIFNQILSTHPKSAETLFQLGRLELLEGQPKKAKKHLLKALRLVPKQPEIWFALMDVEIALRDANGVKKLFNSARAAKLPPPVLKQLASKAKTGNRQGVATLVGISPAEFDRARGAYMTGDFKQAEQIASKLLKRAPKNAPLQAIRAASLAQMGEIPMARRAYEKAIAIDPEYMEARMQLGQLLTGIGEFDEATTHLTKALEMAAEAPHAHLALGVLMTRMHNHRKAIEHLEFARKFLPDDPRLNLFLSKAYYGDAQNDAAAEALARVGAGGLSVQELIERASTLLELDKVDDALAEVEKLAKQFPDRTEVLGLQARIYTQTGDVERMRKTVRKLLEMGEANGDHLLSYARSGKMERNDPVVRALDKLLKQSKGSSENTETSYSIA
ncbi:MAG TPA: tetratricopeptide repeat protein, partial [Devosia sp.]|nr:tetratricopeptide repeat protein [Devosia sp.]